MTRRVCRASMLGYVKRASSVALGCRGTRRLHGRAIRISRLSNFELPLLSLCSCVLLLFLLVVLLAGAAAIPAAACNVRGWDGGGGGGTLFHLPLPPPPIHMYIKSCHVDLPDSSSWCCLCIGKRLAQLVRIKISAVRSR